MPKSIKKAREIYMDYASSATANPSSIHKEGVKAKNKLENARKIVANVLSARKSEIIFTSSGTESNNLAIQGMVFECRGKKLPHIITTNIEHASVLETFKLLKERKLAEITIVPVETDGIVDPKKIKKEIKKNTVLVSVMYANNEIGTIQPIKEIAKEIRHWRKTHLTRFQHPLLDKERVGERFPVFHTDAVQAGNYLDLNVEKLGVDLLSLSGSKIFEAGRVGVLYKRSSVPLINIFGGGDQEMGLRPGTENVSEILKFSKALQSVQSIREKESERLRKLRDYFLEKLRKTFIFSGPRFSGAPTPARPFENESFSEFLINGSLKQRLPNNVNITIPNIPSDLLVIELSARGIMVSAKSACKSGDSKASYVIKAINNNIKETDGSLRFSFGSKTSKSDIDYTVKTLSKILLKLKKWYN